MEMQQMQNVKYFKMHLHPFHNMCIFFHERSNFIDILIPKKEKTPE